MTRLRVVKNDKPASRTRKRTREGTTVEAFSCGSCTEELGFSFASLTQARIGGTVINGNKLVGGSLHWACSRCNRPYFHIKDFPSK